MHEIKNTDSSHQQLPSVFFMVTHIIVGVYVIKKCGYFLLNFGKVNVIWVY